MLKFEYNICMGLELTPVLCVKWKFFEIPYSGIGILGILLLKIRNIFLQPCNRIFLLYYAKISEQYLFGFGFYSSLNNNLTFWPLCLIIKVLISLFCLKILLHFVKQNQKSLKLFHLMTLCNYSANLLSIREILHK